MLRKIIAPPIYEDPKENYTASLLNGILNILIPAMLAVAFLQSLRLMMSGGDIEGYAQMRSAVIIQFTLLIVSAAIKYLNHSGWVRLASVFFIIGLMAVSIYAISDGGIRDSSISFMIITLIIASLLLNRWGALLFTFLGLLAVGVIHFFQFSNILPYTLPQQPLPEEIGPFFSAMFIISLLQFFVIDRLHQEYQRAYANEIELMKSSESLSQMQNQLEEVAAEQTKQLEQRDHYLKVSARIAQESSSYDDPSQLLDRVANLISEEFGYYHVGAFLIDNAFEWATLEAASSSIGKELIGSGYRVRVGRQGIIGFVTSIGQPRTQQLLQADAGHGAKGEFPDTRSELALPIKNQDQIIGALDIHDTNENAFPEDIIQLLQTLADQVAISLNNARLQQQARSKIEESQQAFIMFNRQAWLDAQRRGALPTYRYHRGGPGGTDKLSDEEYKIAHGESIVEIPLTVRGQKIGTIDVSKGEDGEEWSENEQVLLRSLADQISLALDSARLFDETQRYASFERMITDVSTHVRESLNLENILMTAAEKVRETLNLPEVSVRLASGEQTGQDEDLNKND